MALFIKKSTIKIVNDDWATLSAFQRHWLLQWKSNYSILLFNSWRWYLSNNRKIVNYCTKYVLLPNIQHKCNKYVNRFIVIYTTTRIINTKLQYDCFSLLTLFWAVFYNHKFMAQTYALYVWNSVIQNGSPIWS